MGRQVAIVAYPYMGPSFPSSIQGPARQTIITSYSIQLITRKTNYKKIISTENSAEPRLKYEDPPTKEKQFINLKTVYKRHPHQWEALNLIVLKYHKIFLRPNSYVGGGQSLLY